MIYPMLASVGPVPLAVSLCAMVLYVRLLMTGKRTEARAVGAFFASIFLGAIISALIVANSSLSGHQAALAAQWIAFGSFLLLFRLYARKAGRRMLPRSDMPRQKLALTGACSAISAAAIIFFPVDLERHCDTFRCRGFDAMFGDDQVFSYYYCVGIAGVLAWFLVLATTVNVIRGGSSASSSWDKHKKNEQ